MSGARSSSFMILETAVEVLPDEPASSAARICREGSCHPFGELRSSWKSIQVSHLPPALGVNCRFSDDLGHPGPRDSAPPGNFGIIANRSIPDQLFQPDRQGHQT